MPKIYPGLLSALLGVTIGLGTFTFRYAEGLSYFSNNPDSCANCHIMRDYLASWRGSPHHTRAVCNDCHAPHDLLPKLITKADNGWNHSVKFTLQTAGDPIRIRPVNSRKLQENCVRCHRMFVDEIRAVPAHSDSEDVNCVRCHAGVGHGPRR